MRCKKPRYILRKNLLRAGSKSKPVLVEKEGQKFVFKVFGRNASLSHEDAKLLSTQIKAYHNTLKATGLRVSKLMQVSPVQESVKGKSTGKWLLATKEQFIGKGKDTLKTISNCSKSKAINFQQQMLEELYKVTSHNSKPNAPSSILIDSVPKNWAENKQGKLVYVDFFTPKFLDKQGKLYPFFETLHRRGKSFLQFRYQNKGGIYATLLIYLVAERPPFRKEFEKNMLSFLRKKGEAKAAGLVEKMISRNYQVNFIDSNVVEKIPLKQTGER